jgi:hypothetical protein
MAETTEQYINRLRGEVIDVRNKINDLINYRTSFRDRGYVDVESPDIQNVTSKIIQLLKQKYTLDMELVDIDLTYNPLVVNIQGGRRSKRTMIKKRRSNKKRRTNKKM